MSEKAEIAGKVVATSSYPSTVDTFHFWLKSSREDAIEVGNIVTVEDKVKDERIYGLVTKMQYYTDADSPMTDLLGHEFGDPEAEPPTLRQSIHLVTAEVIGASTPRIRPVCAGQVRLATSDEIMEAYGMDGIEDPILIGVIPNGRKMAHCAPALLSERFVLGPEGAHVNLSGASGLATKTSAAVFLIRSILSRARREERKVAVVAFNVKERDLLYLERNGGEDLPGLLAEYGNDWQRRMATILKEYGVSMEFDDSSLKYFAPGRPRDPDTPQSLRADGKVRPFYWSLDSVKRKDGNIRLAHLLDPDDIDERAIGVLSEMEDLLETDWKDVEHFSGLISQLQAGQKEWRGHSGATVAKVRRLLRVNCGEILRGLFSYDDSAEQDIPLDKLRSGECYVIDIQSLNDKGKRIVFFNVLSRLAAMLEKSKIDKDQGKDVPLDVVIVFVDELNKFAPSGRAFGHGLKEQIVEIAARGRSVGLILFGAEQFASTIDKEVYGNCSSHFVGRTEYVELADSAYRWISRDLMYVASTLPKGALLCKHALFARPMLIRFPKPLHTYEKAEIEEILQAKKPAEVKKASADEGREIEHLMQRLKGRSNQSPVSYYQAVRAIRDLGMGQSKFTSWYKSWVAKRRYQSGSETERRALRLLIEYLSKDTQ
jgi:hypothetical protein